jgi:hypothetical protein
MGMVSMKKGELRVNKMRRAEHGVRERPVAKTTKTIAETTKPIAKIIMKAYCEIIDKGKLLRKRIAGVNMESGGVL